MKFVQVRDLREGNKICANIYFPDGRIMLRENTLLTSRLICHLERLNINGVYIEDETFEGLTVDDGIGEDIRLQVSAKLREAWTDIEKKGDFDSQGLMDMANRIVDILMSKPDFIVQLRDMRTKENYIFSHSINVCILAILIAKSMGYNMLQIKQVALGALLHDIGYAQPGLSNKINDHPRAGFELLRCHHEVHLLSAHMAFQHHEMVNGQGFPMGLKGEKFREYGQICGVANDFDHFVNGIDQAHLPHEAIEYIMSKSGTAYDLPIIQAFIKVIAPYPVGTKVQLNNGVQGMVVQVEKANPSRPYVKETSDSQKINLQATHTLFIEKVLV